ncbi:hypothetical protein ACFL6M_01430 [Candidatus Eisenbacteria bacterium]|uniref:Uncharacterized protein n=1 Tax=Eiseniibacteriota bacterium TaxID=2212470 RepID=A0ABV6YJC4_UNCEI
MKRPTARQASVRALLYRKAKGDLDCPIDSGCRTPLVPMMQAADTRQSNDPGRWPEWLADAPFHWTVLLQPKVAAIFMET